MLSTADREMKEVKVIKHSDHDVVWPESKSYSYAKKKALRADRTRIAVVINGDEQVVVEERIKNRIYCQLREKFAIEDFALMKGSDVRTCLLKMEEDKFYDSRPTATIHSNKQPYRSASGFSVASLAGSVAGAAIAHHNKASIAGAIAAGAVVDNMIDQATNGVKSENSTSITVQSKTDVDHMVVGLQPRGFADLRCADFVQAGRKCGYDYVFVLTMNVGMLKHEKHGYVIFDQTTNKGNLWVRVRLVDVANGDYTYRNDIVTAASTHGTRFSGGGVNGRLMEKAVDQAMTEAMNDIAIKN